MTIWLVCGMCRIRCIIYCTSGQTIQFLKSIHKKNALSGRILTIGQRKNSLYSPTLNRGIMNRKSSEQLSIICPTKVMNRRRSLFSILIHSGNTAMKSPCHSTPPKPLKQIFPVFFLFTVFSLKHSYPPCHKMKWQVCGIFFGNNPLSFWISPTICWSVCSRIFGALTTISMKKRRVTWSQWKSIPSCWILKRAVFSNRKGSLPFLIPVKRFWISAIFQPRWHTIGKRKNTPNISSHS